ncbi:MAG: DUF2267 domain-containing protein [Anaerolineae bacterium]|jgi:uncharacterized protein (DUF2267 family)
MEDLVELVSKKVGISEQQAQQAVEIVVGFLKDKLPEPLAGQIEGALEGNLSGLGDLGDMAGGLLGKK